MSASEPAFIVAVVSEAAGDQQIARGLAERILVEEIDWLDEESLSTLCGWRGFDEGYDYVSWSSVEQLTKRPHVVIHGRFAGAFDERRARLALLLFNSMPRRPDAVVLVRDTDNVSERLPSLLRARENAWPFAVILATPHTKRECWILNGFVPRTPQETGALKKVRQELGFDPCDSAERLTAKGRKGKNNAKTVLGKGLGVEPLSDREDTCWRETGLDILRSRGQATLLSAYLEEIVERLVPILDGPSRGA